MSPLATETDGWLVSDVLDLSGTSMRQLRTRNDGELRLALARVEQRSARVQVTVGGGNQTAERVD